MISPERLEGLQRQWVQLLAGFGVPIADAYPPFDRIVEAYSQPHRYYHTLEHVAEMLKLAGRLAKYAANPADVFLAVWYHDAVYDPAAKDNEEQSAVFAVEELEKLSIPSAHVAELIRVTDHKSEPRDADAAILLDADLAILGASEVRYNRYAADVRKEYAFVPEAAYREGRAKVLESFLARPRLYHTPALFADGEAAARENLAREVAVLRGG